MPKFWPLIPWLYRKRSAAAARADAHPYFRPQLEMLENRLAPAGHDTLDTALPLVFDGNHQVRQTGVLADMNQVDLYAVQLQAGEEITAQVNAYAPDNPLDSYLRVFDSTGQQVDWNDDYAGAKDSRVTYRADADGTYYVGLSSYGNTLYNPEQTNSGSNGDSAGYYALTLNVDGSSIAGNTVLRGTYVSGKTEHYRITVADSGRLQVAVTPADGTGFLPRLVLYDNQGALLIQADAVNPNNAAARLDQHLKPGTYFLAISAVANDPLGNQDYRLVSTFEQALPALEPLRVGSNPNSVAVQDVNHDGQPDLIVVDIDYPDPESNPESKVFVFLGLGDGTFQAPTGFSLGPRPKGDFDKDNILDIALGDFNNDDNLDIVTTNAMDNQVSLLLGNGNGTFYLHGSRDVGRKPTAMAVADFDNDGNLDLVTANSGDTTVSVLFGNGDGSFTDTQTVAVEKTSIAVAVGKFNNDDHLDIVTANAEDKTVSVLLGNGDRTFQPAVPYGVGNSPAAVTVGNFNGHLGIVTANADDNTVSVLLGNGDGTFEKALSYPVGGNPTSVAMGYFDADDFLDLAVSNKQPNTVSVLLGNGGGAFQTARSFSVGPNPVAIATADVNQDKHPDLVCVNVDGPSISVVLGRGDGSFLSAASLAVGAAPVAAAVADFNHDGNLDTVTANGEGNTVSVLLGRGDGTFLVAKDYVVGDYPISIAVGDVNGDGNPDLVVANAVDNTVSVLLGRGDGAFLNDPFQPAGKAPGIFPVGDSPFSVVVEDFDQDGKLDFATADFFSNSVSVWLGTGAGAFKREPAFSFGPPQENDGNPTTVPVPVALAVGDFDQDGKRDLAVANSRIRPDTQNHSSPGSITVLLGIGDGTFHLGVSLPAPQGVSAIAVGNLFHHGQRDLVTANQNDGTVSIWEGLDNGKFQLVSSQAVGEVWEDWVYPTSVAVKDFDNDNNPDIVIAMNKAQSLSLLPADKNGPPGTFQHFIHYAVGNYPYAVATGDFNNDGKPDIVNTNSGENTVSVLLNSGGTLFRTTTPQNGIELHNTPYLQDLDNDPAHTPDSLILDRSGALLFRRGLAKTSEPFAPPVTINKDNPARDAVLFQSAAGWTVAAIDRQGNTVAIYRWDSTTGQFQRKAAFPAGNLPVRIAAADLTGAGRLADLVVANDFDHSVTIFLHNDDDSFRTETQVVGAGPAGIAFANLGNPYGPDIIVSDQVSGDFSVLLNDSEHSFSQQYRYHAGAGLFDIDNNAADQIDNNAADPTVSSQLQTVGVLTGRFTSAASDDLIVVNRGSKTFTLLPSLDKTRLADPLPEYTYSTSDRPGQLVRLVLPGDTLPSVAILMEDLSQIWIYRNDPKAPGTFGAPIIVENIGSDPSGLAVTTVHGRLAFLVGNAYGDILTLLSDGRGGFAPDRAHLQDAPLAVGTIAGTGQQYVVVADQARDQVSVFFRIPGTDRFDLANARQIDDAAHLLAPGAVQLFHVTAGAVATTYLAVANSLSNNVCVYQEQEDGQFSSPIPYPVGDNPVSVTAADINGDGTADLLVANKGSNDVSVLIGAIDPNTKLWTATPYQRLASGGSGPLAVAIRNRSGSNVPNLIVTNGDGKVVLLPGIGSADKGSGFFRDVNPAIVDLGRPIAQSTGGQYFVGVDGSLSVLIGNHFTTLVNTGVIAVAQVDSFLAAGFEDGTISLFTDQGILASFVTGFTDPVSGLEVLRNGNTLDVFATQQGSDLPVIVSVEFVPIVTELTISAPVGQGITLPGAALALVATVRLEERLPGDATADAPGDVAFDLFLTPSEEEFLGDPYSVAMLPWGVGSREAESWMTFTLGIHDALEQLQQRQRTEAAVDEILEILRNLLEQFRERLQPTTHGIPEGPVEAALLALSPLDESDVRRQAVEPIPTATRPTGRDGDVSKMATLLCRNAWEQTCARAPANEDDGLKTASNRQVNVALWFMGMGSLVHFSISSPGTRAAANARKTDKD